MATTTNLRFDISSGWSGEGVDDARAQLEALQKQIDSLQSKKVQISADTATVDEQIEDVKRKLDMLSNDDARVKLGIDDATADATIDKLKAQLDTLQNKRIQLQLDDADAELKLEAFKLEMDRLSDKSIKLKVDTSQADRAFKESSAEAELAANKATDAWAKSSFAMQRASLNLFSAFMMLLPAIVPIGTAALGVGGAVVSGFGSAGVAAGIFGLSLAGTLKSAMGIYTQTNQLNQTLAAQKQTLDTLTPGSAAYNSELVAIKSTQSQLNAAMAQGTPVQQQVAKSLMGVKDAWTSMQKQAEAATGPIILGALNGVKSAIGFLPPVIKSVAGAFAPVVADFDHFAASNGMQKFVNWVISTGVPNLKNIIETVKNLFVTVTQIATSFSKSGTQLTAWMAKVTSELDKWGANGGFARFQQQVEDAWPKIKQFFDNMGTAIGHLLTALNQLGPFSFSMLSLMARAASSLPIPVVQAFFVAFAGYKAIAAATAAVKGISAAAKSAAAVFTAGKAAAAAFALGLKGTKTAGEESTAAMIANRVAIVAQAAATKIAGAAQAVWTGITNAWKAATEGATLASIGQKIAAIASAVADGIATAAQVAWDAAIAVFEALTAPITLIILAIVAAVAALAFGIYELVTHWSTVWHAIEQVAKDVWGFLTQGWGQFLLLFLGPLGPIIEVAAHWKQIWDGIKVAASAVWDFLKTAWRDTVNALKSAWDAVWGALKSTWDTVWNGIKQIALDVWNALKTAWDSFLNGVKSLWDSVSSAVRTAWDTVWNGIKQIALDVWNALKTAWDDFLNGVKSLWDSVSSALKSTWDTVWNGIKQIALDVWDALKTAWDDFLNGVKSIWDSVSSAVKSAWDTFWNDIKQVASDVWNALKTAWDDFINGVKTVWDDISNAVKRTWDDFWAGLKADMKTAVDDMKGIWDVIKKVFGSPIEFVIRTVLNGGILAAINWIIGKLGGSSNLKVPDPNLPTFASGGHVQGPGTGTSDSIIARVSHGEYIMPAHRVQAIGVNRMNAMRAGAMPRFADGGLVNVGNGAQSNSNYSSGSQPNGTSTGLSVSDIESGFANIIESVGGAGAGILSDMLGGAAGIAKAVGGALDSVANAHIPVISSIAGFLGGGANKAADIGTAIAGALASWGKAEFEKGAEGLIKLVTTKLVGLIPTPIGPLGAMGHGAVLNITQSMLTSMKDDIANFLFNQNQKNVASFGGGVIPTGEHAAIILAALSADGIPQSQWAAWEAGMNTLIGRESGWNSGAVNNYDSNAAAGTPSEGLAQVIAPTFAAYRNPALPNNLLDPVANVAAAINYINRVYGGIQFVQQANANLPAKGYDIGGVLGTGYTLAYNATGVPEGVLNPTGLAGIGGFSGLSALNAGTYTYTGGGGLDGSGTPIVIEVNNNWYGNPTKEAVQYAGTGMADELTQAVIAGVGARTT